MAPVEDAPEPAELPNTEELQKKNSIMLQIFWVIQDSGPAGIQEDQLFERIQGKNDSSI